MVKNILRIPNVPYDFLFRIKEERVMGHSISETISKKNSFSQKLFCLDVGHQVTADIVLANTNNNSDVQVSNVGPHSR